nr:hypothetical protein CFP56_60687 [Quercus suber]
MPDHQFSAKTSSAVINGRISKVAPSKTSKKSPIKQEMISPEDSFFTDSSFFDNTPFLYGTNGSFDLPEDINCQQDVSFQRSIVQELVVSFAREFDKLQRDGSSSITLQQHQHITKLQHRTPPTKRTRSHHAESLDRHPRPAAAVADSQNPQNRLQSRRGRMVGSLLYRSHPSRSIAWQLTPNPLFPADDPTTASAITQHIAKLARKVGGGVGSGSASSKLNAPAKAATPKKPAGNGLAPKTPSSRASSGKKRPMRFGFDDDEDDQDDGDDDESPAKRRQMSRLSKTPAKSFSFGESDEENGGDAVAKVKLEKGSEGPDFGGFGMIGGGHDMLDGQVDESIFNPLN